MRLRFVEGAFLVYSPADCSDINTHAYPCLCMCARADKHRPCACDGGKASKQEGKAARKLSKLSHKVPFLREKHFFTLFFYFYFSPDVPVLCHLTLSF